MSLRICRVVLAGDLNWKEESGKTEHGVVLTVASGCKQSPVVKLNVVRHICNLSFWEAGAGGLLRVLGEPRLHSRALF